MPTPPATHCLSDNERCTLVAELIGEMNAYEHIARQSETYSTQPDSTATLKLQHLLSSTYRLIIGVDPHERLRLRRVLEHYETYPPDLVDSLLLGAHDLPQIVSFMEL